MRLLTFCEVAIFPNFLYASRQLMVAIRLDNLLGNDHSRPQSPQIVLLDAPSWKVQKKFAKVFSCQITRKRRTYRCICPVPEIWPEKTVKAILWRVLCLDDISLIVTIISLIATRKVESGDIFQQSMWSRFCSFQYEAPWKVQNMLNLVCLQCWGPPK